jgi:hypothetical protein
MQPPILCQSVEVIDFVRSTNSGEASRSRGGHLPERQKLEKVTITFCIKIFKKLDQFKLKKKDKQLILIVCLDGQMAVV